MSESINYSDPEGFPVKVVGDEAIELELVAVSKRDRRVGDPDPVLRWKDTNVRYVTKSFENGETILTDVDTGTQYRPVSIGAPGLVEPIA